MLDDYNNEQPIIYKILKNQIKNEKNSHAYLFETNSYYNSQNFINAFIKSLLCPNNYTNKNNCGKCHQCEVIESGNFPEIKIINPDGMWIKKDQLKELQAEFNEKAIVGNKRIYIINEAEKLNTSAANSILKFLEEPEGNIIAILLTENIYEVMETIRSRCQILRFKEKEKDISNLNEVEKIIQLLNLEDTEENEIIIKKTIDFINYYEEKHLDTLLYLNKIWHDTIKTKDDIIIALDVLTMFYKDILNYKITNNLEILAKNNKVENIIKNNETKDICKKINTIIKAKNNIKYNANTNLLIDKLIIELEGGI